MPKEFSRRSGSMALTSLICRRTWYDAAVRVRAFFALFAALLAGACSSPPPSHPGLSPQAAQQLLRYNQRAVNHLKFVQHENPSCQYVLNLPDQSGHPDSVEVDHIVSCGGRTDFKAYDASVEFEWNKATGQWEISHFGS